VPANSLQQSIEFLNSKENENNCTEPSRAA
jgi:hypothetical protein